MSYNFADIPKETRLHEGRMSRYSVRTKHAQVVFAEITPQPPGQQTYHRPPHNHPYDQMVVVLKGTMKMEIDDLEYDLTAGTAIVIPALVMHRGYALGDTPPTLIEVFAPARRDYLNLVEYQEEDFGDDGEPWVREEFDSWDSPNQ
jgi:quercetin dioxygenase-like cupin family protein